ncbi:MAG: Gfo/Idh/MocA family oxidoreductase [Bacteroidales bacterium]|nr:Gfo/Idh/MocA family oxidoreductase [Bacteroidales bacterium]
MNRLEFLRRAGALMAAGALAPAFSNNLFAKGQGANERINVALIGCHSMGWSDLRDALRVPEVRCIALCDVDRKVLEERAAELEKSTGVKPDLYGDYRKLLERKDLDAVIIGTPDHWHCLQMVDACAAGKDVYVEKPVANSIGECDLMVAAARKYGRVVQVGQQQRSATIWHEMKKYVDSGKLGHIARVNVWANFGYASILNPVPDQAPPEYVDFDMWLGPAPLRTFNQNRFHGLWRMFWDYGGGLLTDWGVHLLDMALWGMNVKGMPKRIMASGGDHLFPDDYAETFNTLSVIYEFDDFIITWNNVTVESGPYGKNYGVEFVGQNGSLVANRESWEIYPYRDKIESYQCLPDGKDHLDHLANFFQCMKTRNMDTACTIDNGALCAKYAHLGNIAARIKSDLVYDDVRKKFDNREADKYFIHEYRRPWKLPKL